MKTNQLSFLGWSMMWTFATFLFLPAVSQAQTDVDLTEVINYLEAECAEDTVTSSESCMLLETALACQAGDSTSCATIFNLTWDFTTDGTSTETGDADDGFDLDGMIDDINAWLEVECAEDSLGVEEYCGWLELAVACATGDSVSCAGLEEVVNAYLSGSDNDGSDSGDDTTGSGDDSIDEENDNDSADGDDDDDEYEGEEGDDDDDEYEGEEGDDDDDEYEGGDDDSDWTLEGALSWLNEECAEDTTGMDAACGLAALAEACLAGDSLACASFEADFGAYAWSGDDDNDDDEYEGGEGDDDDDEYEGGEGDDDDDEYEGAGEIDSDDDGLTDDEETLYATSALNPDTDGDGLSDGDEVLKFNLSPLMPDTDGNGILDPVDLVYTLMEQVNPCPSDLNRDGMVTVADMLMFLVDFSITCSAQ